MVEMNDGDSRWTLHLRKKGGEYVGGLCQDNAVSSCPLSLRVWTAPDDDNDQLLLGTWKNTDDSDEKNDWPLLFTRMAPDEA